MSENRCGMFAGGISDGVFFLKDSSQESVKEGRVLPQSRQGLMKLGLRSYFNTAAAVMQRDVADGGLLPVKRH